VVVAPVVARGEREAGVSEEVELVDGGEAVPAVVVEVGALLG
jgi:hypothetical protein